MGAIIVYGVAIIGFIIFIKGLYVRTVDFKKKNEIRNTNKKDKKKLKKELKQKYKTEKKKLKSEMSREISEKNKENG